MTNSWNDELERARQEAQKAADEGRRNQERLDARVALGREAREAEVGATVAELQAAAEEVWAVKHAMWKKRLDDHRREAKRRRSPIRRRIPGELGSAPRPIYWVAYKHLFPSSTKGIVTVDVEGGIMKVSVDGQTLDVWEASRRYVERGTPPAECKDWAEFVTLTLQALAKELVHSPES